MDRTCIYVCMYVHLQGAAVVNSHPRYIKPRIVNGTTDNTILVLDYTVSDDTVLDLNRSFVLRPQTFVKACS